MDKLIEIIYRELKGIIPETDFTEYSAKRNEGDKVTQTVFRICAADKINRLALEQYQINSKAHGVVLNIYPKPETGIPLFTFQIGGQVPDKVILVIDIIPLRKSGMGAELEVLYKKHAGDEKQLGTSQDWVSRICTKNAIICQYKPFEPAKILEAFTDYLRFWRDSCYLPATEALSEEEVREANRVILNFKSVLHANDAGLNIYLKKFGRAMVSAIEDAAFGCEPPLLPSVESAAQQPEATDKAESTQGIRWTAEAEEYLLEAPKFVRSKIRNNAEKKALESGIQEITRDFVEKLRS
ncbi:MAG: hypothetical protein WCK92_14320 [Bacteroidota bacterium]